MRTKKNWKYATEIQAGDYININNRGREVLLVTSWGNVYTIVYEEYDVVNNLWAFCQIKTVGAQKIIMADTAGINKWKTLKSAERE